MGNRPPAAAATPPAPGPTRHTDATTAEAASPTVASASAPAANGPAADAKTPPPGASFFSFVRSELFVADDASNGGGSAASALPSQLVYNFLVLPWYLERLLTLGFMICLDCFLHLFTVLPLRMAVAIIGLARSVLFPFRASPTSPLRFSIGVRLNGAQLCDLCRGLLLLTCWYGLAFINMSRMYHYIRGQSVLKLYVIFNMLQISDRLFCSFGEDILESLFASIMVLANGSQEVTGKAKVSRSSKPVQVFHVLFHFAISVIYIFGHSLLLFAQVITVNVSVNSDNSSLFVLLVSNNFIELKGAVFKRFDHHNLMQISASDIVERFQLTIFLLVIIVQNLAHIGLAFADDWLEKAGTMCFMVLGGEWIIDWIKHGFITKFNGIPPVVYRHFAKVLCTDFIHTHKHKTESASIHNVSRRLGLPSLPIAVLVVRVVYQAFLHSPSHILVKSGLLLIGFICLSMLKCLLTIVLLGHAAKRVIIEPLEREKAEAFTQALNAPAHQHVHTKSHTPSPFTIILPKPSPIVVASALPTPVLSVPTPPLERQAQAVSSFQSGSNAAYASSTNSSPSMFGIRESSSSKLGGASSLALSPLALDGPSSRAISRSSTPRSRHSPHSTPGGAAPSPSALLHSIAGLTSGSSPSSRAQATADASAPVPCAEPQHPQLSVSITDADGSPPSEDSLTGRFSVHTPTALERYSNLSPEPSTPQVFTQTITLQLDNKPPQHVLSSIGASVSSALSGEPSAVSSPHPADLTTSSVETCSVSSAPSTTDHVEIVQLPQPTGSQGSEDASRPAILHIHHHHHQVPTASPAEDGNSSVGSSTSSSSSGPSATPAAGGADSTVTSTSVTYAPTVVTINSSSVKEKAAPAYDDASKIESDLLSVERYKISAGKAIPV